MSTLDQAIAVLKAENKRLTNELEQLHIAIAALTGASKDGHYTMRRRPSRRMSAAGRRRIAAAQKARWAKWKAARRKKAH